MAASTAAWSLVGTWTERPLSLNATTPMTTLEGWRSTKAVAIALAAAIRVSAAGLPLAPGAGVVAAPASVAAMLPDTSNTRTTVPSSCGMATTACGRASATMSVTMPASRMAAGR